MKGATNNLLGKQEMQDLNIINIVGNIKIADIVSRFPALFDGLGMLPEVFKIHLQSGGRPYNLSVPRRVPIGL